MTDQQQTRVTIQDLQAELANPTDKYVKQYHRTLASRMDAGMISWTYQAFLLNWIENIKSIDKRHIMDEPEPPHDPIPTVDQLRQRVIADIEAENERLSKRVANLEGELRGADDELKHQNTLRRSAETENAHLRQRVAELETVRDALSAKLTAMIPAAWMEIMDALVTAAQPDGATGAIIVRDDAAYAQAWERAAGWSYDADMTVGELRKRVAELEQFTDSLTTSLADATDRAERAEAEVARLRGVVEGLRFNQAALRNTLRLIIAHTDSEYGAMTRLRDIKEMADGAFVFTNTNDTDESEGA